MVQEQLVRLTFPHPKREWGEKLVRVFVPAHEEGETLPVIYMTDGQNLFDVESSNFGCWFTREAMEDERAKSGRAAILVGIHNEDLWRPDELTPRCIGAVELPPEPPEPIELPPEAPPLPQPAGELFEALLVEHIMPAVEARFPVKTGRENTAVCGSSCGGMMSFYLALRHPELFCAAGVLSPAFLIYRREDLQRWIETRLQGNLPFLYLYSGAGDELERNICRCTEETWDFLQGRWPEDRMVKDIRPALPHHETAWDPVFRVFLHRFLTGQTGRPA